MAYKLYTRQYGIYMCVDYLFVIMNQVTVAAFSVVVALNIDISKKYLNEI